MNLDGYIDLILANRNKQPNRIYFGPDFLSSSVFGSGKDETRQVAIGDMDGDGYPDIVAVNIGEKNKIFYNNGTGQFKKSLSFGSSSDKTMSVTLGDLDSDGDLDIVTGNNRNKNHYYINNDLKFRLNHFSENDKITYGITLVDLNNDGTLDIIESNSGDVNKIFFNKTQE